MDDETKGDFESHRTRRTPNSRQRTPQATRATRHKKKSPDAVGMGGVHRRRNKHWSW